MDGLLTKVFIIDNDRRAIASASRALTREGYVVSSATDPSAGIRECAEMKPGFILLDSSCFSHTGPALISTLLQAHPHGTILITTHQDHCAQALEWMRLGAIDCLRKPLNIPDLLQTMERSRERMQLQFASLVQDTACIVKEEKTLVFGNDIAKLPHILNQAVMNTNVICRNTEMLKMALNEIVLNAIEHGNLNILKEEKADAVRRGVYSELIETRKKEPLYRERVVTLRVVIDTASSVIMFYVTDQGTGFDYRNMVETPPGGTIGIGLGIEIARNFFTEVSYSGRGNRVKLVYAGERE
ncbi:MAG: response regulator [Desulfomonilia bacterium]